MFRISVEDRSPYAWCSFPVGKRGDLERCPFSQRHPSGFNRAHVQPSLLHVEEHGDEAGAGTLGEAPCSPCGDGGSTALPRGIGDAEGSSSGAERERLP